MRVLGRTRQGLAKIRQQITSFALVAGIEYFLHLEGLTEQSRRLAIVKDTSGALRCHLPVTDRLGQIGRLGRVGEMLGQLRGVLTHSVSVYAFERPGYLLVQPHAARGDILLVERCTEEGVGKPVGGRSPYGGSFLDHCDSLRFFNRLE